MENTRGSMIMYVVIIGASGRRGISGRGRASGRVEASGRGRRVRSFSSSVLPTPMQQQATSQQAFTTPPV